jgi:diguanylate cyclase (GGDEF)-like protein/PAS domain S-box-containing protein
MKDYRLADLLDMSLVQTLADSNFRATGLPISIADAFDRSFLVRTGWTDLCSKFHRAFPASNQICRAADATVRGQLIAGEAFQYKCQFGLWHVAIPITVAGQHLATMFMTQFCVAGEVPDRDFFISKSHQFGYDLNGYLAATERVPVLSREKVDYIITYYQAMVRFISDLAEHSLELKKSQAELEDKVQARTAELANANEFLENIFDNSADSIGITDQHGHMIKWNKAGEAMYGYSFAELQDIKAFDLYADREELKIMLAQLRRDGFVKNYEIDMMKKDGSSFPCSLSVKILRDAENKNIGGVTVSRDLTEVKKTMANFEAANKQLQVLVAETNELNRHMALLQEMNDFFQSCQSAEETYSTIAHYTPKFFPDYQGALYLLNNSENFFEIATSWGEASSLEVLFGHNDCWALRRSRMVFVDNPQTALNCQHVSSSLSTGYLCLPLMAQGKALGILHLQKLTSGPIANPEALEQHAKPVTEAMSLALANLKLRETLKNQAIRDGLTGLFNRRYLNETLERELSRGNRLGNTTGVIMLDLDHFKEYNDIYGHNAGDELLVALGKIIRTQTRQEDIACRYGGEEFLIIMPGTDLETALERTEELHQLVKELHLSNRFLRPVTISAGVAVYPVHGSTGKEVIRSADAALYRAKADGRDRVVVADGVAAFATKNKAM